MGGAKAIAGRLDDAVYGIYCDYASDWTGEYTVVIGCEVDAAAPAPPDGMRRVEIGPGRFAVYTPAGVLPMSVWATWAEVWKTPLKRRYAADFDRYGADGVTVWVGVK
jgi:predicted transcriptional regulator YdeE